MPRKRKPVQLLLKMQEEFKPEYPEGLEVTRVISFGAGVQSTVMALMGQEGAFGELPDYAVFADPGWEPKYIYKHVEWMHEMLHIPLYVTGITPGIEERVSEIKSHTGNHGYLDIPVHILKPDGSASMGSRHCTTQYKILPIQKKIRELWGIGYRQRVKKHMHAEQWMGITIDEYSRVKSSREKWITNRYPLIELGMSRQDCLDWWEKRFPERDLFKSACLGCPYQSPSRWLDTKERFPDEFAKLVEIDKNLRSAGVRRVGESFLHRSKKPLDVAVAETAQQMESGEVNDYLNECEGHCGV